MFWVRDSHGIPRTLRRYPWSRFQRVFPRALEFCGRKIS